MIDMHCHLLPGIDDGAQNIDQAVDMARYAVANGIEQIVVTPHIQPGRFDNDQQNIQRTLEQLQDRLRQLQIGLQLHMGAEVHLSPEIMPMIEAERIPFLGKLAGYDVMLLELPHFNLPPGTEKLLQWLDRRQIRVMIAHPERNHEIAPDPERLAPLIEQGALLQVTASSLRGLFGKEAKQSGEALLSRGWVSVIATDAHNMKFRPPNLADGRVAAAEIIGESESWKMVRDNPEAILNKQTMSQAT